MSTELLVIERACQQLTLITQVDELKDLRDKTEAIAKYRRAQGAATEIVNATVEYKIRIERRLGELIPRQSPPGKKIVSCENDLSRLQRHQYRKLAAVPDDDFETALARAKEEALGGELTTAAFWRAATHPSGAAGYDGDEWYTPPDVIECCRTVLGHIDVDPSSNDHAQQTVKARTYYTKANSSLDKEWHGNVFCNPPYSTTLVKQFTNKLIEEYESGRCTAAIYLVNNCTDAGWFHQLFARYPACFTRGRIPFCNKAGEAFATRQGQAIFYLGSDVEKFVRVFSALGVVVQVLQ